MTYDEIIERLMEVNNQSVFDIGSPMYNRIEILIKDIKAAKEKLVEVKISTEDANKWLNECSKLKQKIHL